MPRWSRTAILDHRGLVAGMDDELGLGEGLARPTPPTPETRVVTVGHAVTAMVLKGLGVVPQPRSLGPRGCQNAPTQRLVAPGSDAPHLPDDTRGRALDPRSAAGGTARSRRLAVTAAHRLGLTPTWAPLERPSFPGDGRDHRGEAPDAPVLPRTRGDRRAPRPDRHHVRLDVRVAHPAGMPVLMKPRRGPTRETRAVGPVVTEPVRPLQPPAGTTSLVADRARSRDEHLPPLVDPGTTGRTRVPATWTEAPHAWEQATPAAR